MLERTALKYYPIIQEVAKRMTKHKENTPPIVRSSSYQNLKDKAPEEDESDENLNPYQSKWIMNKQRELKSKEKEKSLANQINMRVLLGYLN